MINKQKEFFKKRLGELSEKFPELKIRYEYREDISMHLIEVLPEEVFESNKDYIIEEANIEKQFENLFGADKEVYFLSSDVSFMIKNPEITFGY
jgi:hypothetical protein